MKNIFQKKEGFTLVEMMVSVAVFSAVFAVGVGGFVSAMRTQRQLQSLISANGNASLAIEQMAREIRTGMIFHTVPTVGCTLPCHLDFVNAKNEDVSYLWDPAEKQIIRIDPTLGRSIITAENVAVQYLNFNVLGDTCSSKPDHNPRVTISLGISPRSEKVVDQIVTEIQTTVASRQGFTCERPVIQVE